MKNKVYVNALKYHSMDRLSKYLLGYLNVPLSDEYRDLVFLCIGTDRATGDSLGPIVGHNLKKYNSQNFSVYGTLKNPVHAQNLEKTIIEIKSNYYSPFIIAIDAALGNKENIGYISLGFGSIRPGSGVNKSLPETGNMHITGIVSTHGKCGFTSLQNARLYPVITMANVISNSLFNTVEKHMSLRRLNCKIVQ